MKPKNIYILRVICCGAIIDLASFANIKKAEKAFDAYCKYHEWNASTERKQDSATHLCIDFKNGDRLMVCGLACWSSAGDFIKSNCQTK